ncbi:kinase [Kitasatospora sp. GP82]|uniref:GHMP family kinase ATP-binding protein n=1 Tax=Kitasatospora sp. GP82 TaxID=3035089 RepID=UPI002475380D|nr:kinase [Kitasatospora sp. GP82]MDH6125379.1 uncharacterized protein involved in propanediol utilization [Kitasatospora sp. GP82]
MTERQPIGVGVAHGTFGELLQGVLPNGLDFLVTLPITDRSIATFQPLPDRFEVEVYPPSKRKSRRLAEELLRAYARPVGGRLQLISSLSEGKGFASSSADLVATARAVGQAYNIDLDEEEVESFLREIEPTDGVMYPDTVAFYHREVRLRERLGFLPELTIVAHDEGGEVDTVAFNRLPKPFDHHERRHYADLLEELTRAIRDGDLPAVGAVSTRSAELNAKLRPRAGFEELLQIAREVAGFGLILAHSGTTLGILLDGSDSEAAEKIAYVRKSCRPLGGSVSTYRTLGKAGVHAL